MPAPTADGADKDQDQIGVSWEDIVNDWDTIVSDLHATYGSSVDRVKTWPDLRRLILGLMGRKTSLFAVGKALEHQTKNTT